MSANSRKVFAKLASVGSALYGICAWLAVIGIVLSGVAYFTSPSPWGAIFTLWFAAALVWLLGRSLKWLLSGA